MRVVEYQKDAQSLAFRWLQGAAVVSAAFTALILALMIWNLIATQRADPIHAPALIKLTDSLKSAPQDQALKEQIRDLDFLARHAFFSAQHFETLSIYFLLGGAVATVVAFKSLQAYRERAALPMPNPAREDLGENAKWARGAITAVGLVLTGIALSLSIPWRSPLDTPVAPTPPKAKPSADNWPMLLGGSVSASLPTEWDGASGRGVRWKTEIPRPGHGSPIIWGQRVFVSGGDNESRVVYCVDVDTGAILWSHEVSKGDPHLPVQIPNETTLAASTMATDGERIFAIFGSSDLIALDFAGKVVWSKNLGPLNNGYGHGSSLAIEGDVLLVQLDQTKNGVFLGIDTRTGETRWKTDRKFQPAWSTPRIVEIAGKRQAILTAAPAVAGYDLNTGTELWRVDCFGEAEVAPSAVFANGKLIVAADNLGILSIDPEKRAVVWKETDDVPGVVTACVAGDLMFYGLNDGGIVCRKVSDGKKVWSVETDEGFYASPLLSGERVFLLDRAGTMKIFVATNEYKLLAQPKLGEEVNATPSAHGNNLFVRGKKHLFRIGL